jgi:DNA uptake protein ComE-like DNA-binding protein
MTRYKSAVVLLVTLALACTCVFAQTKPAMKPLDINTASEAEIVAVGIEKTAAKKIVENRPYRNKTELVSKMLLSRDQYDKVKDAIVAKQPPKTSSK